MKVHYSQNNKQQIHKNPNFKNASVALRFLATNQAVGANMMDLASMVAPRTASDMIKRGPAAGFETLFREIMGTVNDSLIGLYGVFAGSLVAYGINKTFGFKREESVNKIFTAPETLNILAENKAKQIKNNSTQLDYIKETLNNVKGYNPKSTSADANGFVKISDKTVDEISKYIDEAITKDMSISDWKNSKLENTRSAIMNRITENTGAQTTYILESTDKKLNSHTNLENFLDDLFLSSKTFNKKSVKEAFKEQILSGKSVKDNKFIKGISKFMSTRSAIGVAIGALVGIMVQPFNMYMTKKRTGTDGFVGVDGRTKDKTLKFKVEKTIAAAAFGAFILATIPATLTTVMGKMAFKGKLPTISQLKGIYGMTIISRILSARDKDELREVLTKDTLAYINWLILGDFVNKQVAKSMDKDLINYNEKTNGASWAGRNLNSTLKTRDEVIIDALAKNNISAVKEKDGKIVAKTFKELTKDLEKLPEAIRKTTQKRLSILNKAQIIGYLYSGLVLGLGIPNLNIYITNKLDAKRKAQLAKQNEEVKAVA